MNCFSFFGGMGIKKLNKTSVRACMCLYFPPVRTNRIDKREKSSHPQCVGCQERREWPG